MKPKIGLFLFKESFNILEILNLLIKWYEFGSNYTHAVYIHEDYSISEADWKVWYRISPLVNHKPEDKLDIYELTHEISLEQYNKIDEFLKQQKDKGYDVIGLLSFLLRINLDNPNRWFCSELVFAAFDYADIKLLNNVKAWEVSPQNLSESLLLTKVETITAGELQMRYLNKTKT